MKYIIFFIMSAVLYSIFDWIIQKTDIHNKLFNKPEIRQHIKTILIIAFIIFVFLIEYLKQIVKGTNSYDSYISIIAGAFLAAVYLNFVPLIFKRNNFITMLKVFYCYV